MPTTVCSQLVVDLTLNAHRIKSSQFYLPSAGLHVNKEHNINILVFRWQPASLEMYDAFFVFLMFSSVFLRSVIQ